MSEPKPAYEYDMMPGPDGSRVLEIDPSSIRCQHCGKPWPECETILPNGELGCPCQVPAPPVIGEQHIAFLESMKGHTWVSNLPLFVNVTETMLDEVIAAMKEYRRMMEQWQ